MTFLLVYFAIGIVAGILSGLFGIGGGIVIVPALIIFCKFNQLAANSTSLAALLLPVGILAVVTYYKAKLIDIRGALLIGLGIFIGIVGGSFSALKLPEDLLKAFYGIFLVVIAWTYIDFKDLFKRAPFQQTKPEFFSNNERHFSVIYYLLLGCFSGILAGLFGIGGGIVIVPGLISVFRYPYKKAVGTSLMALLLPVGLPGVLIYYQTGQLEILPAALIGFGLLIGALAGAFAAIEIPSKSIKRLYGVFILLAGLNFIFQYPGLTR
jgi:hypothetical protein